MEPPPRRRPRDRTTKKNRAFDFRGLWFDPHVGTTSRKWKKRLSRRRFPQIEVIPSGFINLHGINFSNKLNGLIYAGITLRAATDKSKASESFDRRRFSGVDCRGGHCCLLFWVCVTSSSYFTDQEARTALSKVPPRTPASGGEAEHRADSIIVETDRKGRAVRNAVSTIVLARLSLRTTARCGLQPNAIRCCRRS